MGCSFSNPGQSGITKCWSQSLEERLSIPVINLTQGGGGSNSQMLRGITRYLCNNNITDTAFIVQWTNIERGEFCYDDKQWIQTTWKGKTTNTTNYTDQQVLVREMLHEANAMAYSASTHFWQWIHQLIYLNHIMTRNNCEYFQWHMTGIEFKEILTGVKPIEKDFNLKSITKTVSKTPWLFGNVLKAQPQNFHTVSDDDPHPSNKGSEQLAQMFTAEVKKRGWI